MIKKITSIRFDDETLEKLSEIAMKQDRTISWLVRKAVQEFIKKNK